jgi:hypothetical protein
MYAYADWIETRISIEQGSYPEEQGPYPEEQGPYPKLT